MNSLSGLFRVGSSYYNAKPDSLARGRESALAWELKVSHQIKIKQELSLLESHIWLNRPGCECLALP